MFSSSAVTPLSIDAHLTQNFAAYEAKCKVLASVGCDIRSARRKSVYVKAKEGSSPLKVTLIVSENRVVLGGLLAAGAG